MDKQPSPSATPAVVPLTEEQVQKPARYKVVPQRGQASFKVRYVETSSDRKPDCPFCVEPL